MISVQRTAAYRQKKMPLLLLLSAVRLFASIS